MCGVSTTGSTGKLTMARWCQPAVRNRHGSGALGFILPFPQGRARRNGGVYNKRNRHAPTNVQAAEEQAMTEGEKWDEHYKTGNAPWETNRSSPELQQVVGELKL